MAIKTFTDLTTLPASDINTYLANAGLVFVKQQTITPGVSSVTVTAAFSATYDNYLVTVDNLVTTAGSGFPFQLGTTATGYYWAGSVVFYSSGVAGTEWGNNATVFAGGCVTDSTGAGGTQIQLLRPFLSTRTNYMAHGGDSRVGGAGVRTYSGFLNDTNSYTTMTFSTTAGTITSGTIRVYGYRQA